MRTRPPARALLGIACGAAIAAACSDRKADEAKPPPSGDAAPRPVVPDRIEGTLSRDGKPLELVRCRPGHEGTVYVDLVTAAGALRFVGGEAEHMYWNPRPEANERGTPIDCSIPYRSWGGARRDEDGTAYFRGELAFSCRGAAGAFTGRVSLECGNISPLERSLLDDGRRRRREATGKP
jgi:hypothetical protein